MAQESDSPGEPGPGGRIRPDARADVVAKVHPMERRQGRITVLAGIFFEVVFVGTTALAFGMAGELANPSVIVFLLGLSVIPVVLIIAGVKRTKRRPELPEIALTVTDDEVVLAAVPTFRLIRPERPERRWSRSEVTAEFVRGSGFLTHDRITFTTGTGWRRRTQGMSLMPLDTSADAILAALKPQ